jgi:diguanylate cyclase (GGDEF)-like protein
MAGEFQPHTGETFSYGFDQSAYWFRFRIRKKPDFDDARRLVLSTDRPVIEELDLFLPVAGAPAGRFHCLRSGIRRHGAADDLGHSYPALVIPDNIRNDAYIYLRIQTIVASYSIALSSKEYFDHSTRSEYLFFGVVIGIMAAMLLYNLVIAIFLKDKIYAAYCIYIFFAVTYFSFLSGWPMGLGLNPEYLMAVTIKLFSLTFLFGMNFSRLFLATKGNNPLIDRIFKMIMAVAAADLILSLVGYFDIANEIAYFLVLLAPIAVIVFAAIRWCQGYQPAIYYLIAWSVLFVASIIGASSGVGLINYSFMTYNAPSIGAAAESILLSLALAERIRILQREQQKLIEKERRLTELSITDELTGLFNKRWFSSKLGSEIDHTHNVNSPLTLILLDVDHFKRFNDTYGHASGDKVLAELGLTISENIRRCDIACRYGGEEFAIILPNADLAGAVAIAERLRGSFSAKLIKTTQKAVAGVTVSLGVTEVSRDDDVNSFFERADRALYLAKSQGRNQVVYIEAGAQHPTLNL